MAACRPHVIWISSFVAEWLLGRAASCKSSGGRTQHLSIWRAIQISPLTVSQHRVPQSVLKVWRPV
eukprot:2566925-Amphidinium_carterae.1